MSAVAHLRPIFSLTLALQEGVPTSKTPGGTHILVKIDSGYTTPIDSKLPFETTIIGGYDNITNSPDGKFAHLDGKLYGKTKKGHLFSFDFTGVGRISGKLSQVFNNELDSMDFSDGYVSTTYVADVDDAAKPEIGWINEYNVVGRGRFFRDQSKKLFIEYIVHVVE
ncbi:hypothetical protein TRVA0_001S04280 [Trichomonascus vanleenenianus]|uniref:uncharacterized protein n=1 Tax=Trichomonascus vanleenenianus TaxID=2268995 RepID=UPI003ECB9BE9